MKKSRQKDLEFIKQYRDSLFTDKNHMLSILRGRLKIKKEDLSDGGPLTDFDLQGRTFGQYISRAAQEKQYKIKDIAEKLDISISLLERIYDDSIAPWDLEKELIISLGKLLEISNERISQVINGHQLNPWVLKQRLPGGASVARTHHTLQRKIREEELLQANLMIQQSRELDKKNQFLSQLFN